MLSKTFLRVKSLLRDPHRNQSAGPVVGCLVLISVKRFEESLNGYSMHLSSRTLGPVKQHQFEALWVTLNFPDMLACVIAVVHGLLPRRRLTVIILLFLVSTL